MAGPSDGPEVAGLVMVPTQSRHGDEMDNPPELSDEEFTRRHRHAEEVEAAAERDRLRALHLELFGDFGDHVALPRRTNILAYNLVHNTNY